MSKTTIFYCPACGKKWLGRTIQHLPDFPTHCDDCWAKSFGYPSLSPFECFSWFVTKSPAWAWPIVFVSFPPLWVIGKPKVFGWLYRHAVRPVLFSLDAERAHQLSLETTQIIGGRKP